MKNFHKIPALALSICATGAIAGVALPDFDIASVRTRLTDISSKENISKYSGTPTLDQLKAFASGQTRTEEVSDAQLPKGVVVEKVLDKDFSDWTAGSLDTPDNVSVGADDTLFDKLFGADSGWSVYQAYQAGGNMYLGYDEVGDNGPGYFMTPVYDFTDPKVAYRFRVTAMNVNANAQEQGLQAFFMSQKPGEDSGQIIAASAVPMKYNEWSVCEWVGKVRPADSYVRGMALGWQGKVMIKNITFEKLIYPLASVSDINLSYQPGKLSTSWSAVEGADEYKATLYVSTQDDTVEIGTVKTSEPAAAFDMFLSEAAEKYSVTVVALNEAGEESYPTSNYAELAPTSVGDAVALPATNVSAEGFTANWEAIADAGRTLVYPVQYHKATETQQYTLLNEDFSNVPEENDIYRPAQIIPMMGMGNMDLMMSRAGWSTDICIFFRLTPEMPSLALTNMFAEAGLPGYLLSPVYDLSVGGGKVFISGMAMSGADDAVLTFFLVDADTNEPYASEDVEVNTNGVLIDIDLEGGRPNSRIMFYMTDYADEEMIVIPSLSISVDMNAGQQITAPLPTEFVAAPATSFDFSYPVDSDNSYSYTVQGVFKEIIGEISDVIEVSGDSTGVAEAAAGNGHAVLKGNILDIANPDGEKVTVVSADGKILALTDDTAVSLKVAEGAVIVRIGGKCFKFIR